MVPTWHRLIAMMVYMLPWSDAIPLGGNLFLEYSFLKVLAIPTFPIFLIENSIPFGNFFLFIILFLAVIRNPKISYFIRFNTMQSLLLNIALLIIVYFLQIIINPLGNILLIQTMSNIIFILSLAIIIFCITKSIFGEEPELPGISEAVRLQI